MILYFSLHDYTAPCLHSVCMLSTTPCAPTISKKHQLVQDKHCWKHADGHQAEVVQISTSVPVTFHLRHWVCFPEVLLTSETLAKVSSPVFHGLIFFFPASEKNPANPKPPTWDSSSSVIFSQEGLVQALLGGRLFSAGSSTHLRCKGTPTDVQLCQMFHPVGRAHDPWSKIICPQ